VASNRKFTQEDFVVAAIGGSGLFLMIVGGLLLGFGTVENSTSELFALSGLLLLILATVLWLFWRRPWERFDDLQTGYYTGHHDDHAEVVVKEPAAKSVQEAESAAELAVAQEQPSEEKATPATKTVKEVKPAKPDQVTEPQDLTKIEGLGKKTQQALYADNITTYAQIADLSPDQLEEIVKVKHGVRVISGATKTWPKQARFLAEDDIDGLQAYQDTLVGGREVD
jgi:predicted flap endonuclease-1-like 5' DNA nuclease